VIWLYRKPLLPFEKGVRFACEKNHLTSKKKRKRMASESSSHSRSWERRSFLRYGGGGKNGTHSVRREKIKGQGRRGVGIRDEGTEFNYMSNAPKGKKKKRSRLLDDKRGKRRTHGIQSRNCHLLFQEKKNSFLVKRKQYGRVFREGREGGRRKDLHYK